MGAIADRGVAWVQAEKAFLVASDLMDALKGQTLVITGATGLIGSQVARVLLCANELDGAKIKLILPVRDLRAIQALFGDREDVLPISWNLGEKPQLPRHCDAFVHAACSTSSNYFSKRPATTSLEIYDGTAACLAGAKSSECDSFILLSTMEVYGEPAAHPATETDLGSINPMVLRNSYPIAKLAAENLAIAYGFEQGMRVAVLRLAQTFGVGARREDRRVFAEFARKAVIGDDIVLLTDGSKRSCYLSVNDAATAVITLLARADSSGAYNAANGDTYCSIREMAELVIDRFGVGKSSIRFRPDVERAKTFRNGSDILLDTSRLCNLGWSAHEGLEEMYTQMIKGWE